MFDKDLFRRLLIKARGSRTNEEYSKESGVSRAYISAYVNSKRDERPSAEILIKLAAKAANNVTYEDFMAACGYFDEESKEIMKDPQIRAIARATRKLSVEKKELLQKLAESMIEEAKKDASEDK